MISKDRYLNHLNIVLYNIYPTIAETKYGLHLEIAERINVSGFCNELVGGVGAAVVFTKCVCVCAQCPAWKAGLGNRQIYS